jgi:hypothetical protein
VNEPCADQDRYRALLKDADDEPKRLALIQLLLAEGAKARLGAQAEPVEPEPPPEQPLHPSLVSLRPAEPDLSPPDAALPSERAAETEAPQAAEDASSENWAVPLEVGDPEPPASEPPKLYSEPDPENVAEHFVFENLETGWSLHPTAANAETETAGATSPVVSDPSQPEDIVDMIAKLLSSHPTNVTPAATTASSAPPPGEDFENSIAAQIQAALEKHARQ